MKTPNVLKVWQISQHLPLGQHVFTGLLCIKIPFFTTIYPLVERLEPDYCKVKMKKTRFLINHVSSIHAIALCNLAEFTGGLMAQVTIPKQYRWIPKGMSVEYLHKAKTNLYAVAIPVDNQIIGQGDYDVKIDVYDQHDVLVFRAIMHLWISN